MDLVLGSQIQSNRRRRLDFDDGIKRQKWFPFDLGYCVDFVWLRTFTAVLNSRAIITSRKVCLFDESSNGSRSCFVNRSPHQFVLVESCPARSPDRKNCNVRVLLQVPFFWRIPDVVEDITFP